MEYILYSRNKNSPVSIIRPGQPGTINDKEELLILLNSNNIGESYWLVISDKDVSEKATEFFELMHVKDKSDANLAMKLIHRESIMKREIDDDFISNAAKKIHKNALYRVGLTIEENTPYEHLSLISKEIYLDIIRSAIGIYNNESLNNDIKITNFPKSRIASVGTNFEDALQKLLINEEECDFDHRLL